MFSISFEFSVSSDFDRWKNRVVDMFFFAIFSGHFTIRFYED